VTVTDFGSISQGVLRVPEAVGNGVTRRISEKQGMRVIAMERNREHSAGKEC